MPPLNPLLYFSMMAISVAAMVIALVLRSRLAARASAWNAALVSVGFYFVVVIAAAFVLPGINEVPESFPATVLWQFRVVSYGMQAVMWTTLGLLFGVLAERVLAAGMGRSPALARGDMRFRA